MFTKLLHHLHIGSLIFWPHTSVPNFLANFARVFRRIVQQICYNFTSISKLKVPCSIMKNMVIRPIHIEVTSYLEQELLPLFPRGFPTLDANFGRTPVLPTTRLSQGQPGAPLQASFTKCSHFFNQKSHRHR